MIRWTILAAVGLFALVALLASASSADARPKHQNAAWHYACGPTVIFRTISGIPHGGLSGCTLVRSHPRHR